jgi:RNA:NAD 2'-phosphotransferase (TPT1/KptA family)
MAGILLLSFKDDYCYDYTPAHNKHPLTHQGFALSITLVTLEKMKKKLDISLYQRIDKQDDVNRWEIEDISTLLLT